MTAFIMANVNLKFETEAQAQSFISWFDRIGEQIYFEEAIILDGLKGKEFVNHFKYDEPNTIKGEIVS